MAEVDTQKREAAAQAAYRLLSLVALPAEELAAQLAPYRLAPWTALGEGKILRVLLDAFDDTVGGVQRRPDWFDIINDDGILWEMRGYLDLLREIGVHGNAHGSRLFDSLEALSREPEWRLLGALAREMLAVLGVEPWPAPFNVPALLVGESD